MKNGYKNKWRTVLIKFFPAQLFLDTLPSVMLSLFQTGLNGVAFGHTPWKTAKDSK